ncbi:MAG TPA: protein translocase subunit SecD [Caulobacteraceae bacterium]|jgi:preprotein translocase subunit SecD|nr:protein translocase subunit SecD [Caulobacteraceae bacterium]
MIQVTRWKVIILSLALVFGVLFTLPNFLTPSQRDALPGFLPHATLHLGLDLQGGSQLLFQVDQPALKKAHLTALVEDIRKKLQDAQIGATEPAVDGDIVRVGITDPSKVDQAMATLQDLAQPLQSAPGTREFLISKNGNSIVFTMPDQALKAETIAAVKQSIEIIRKRIDKTGTKAPNIVPQGLDRILIEAPGESDPEELKRLIGKTAKLTFQMVDLTASPEDVQAGTIPAPPGTVLLPLDGDPRANWVLVRKRVLVSGEDLTNAFLSHDDYNKPAIGFRFNAKGAAKFADVTMNNIGKPFAIVLDNRVISDPRIDSAITGGNGIITGNFTADSASELADLLKSGSLPAKLDVIQQETVGSLLGKEAIKAGEISIAIGFVAIVIFMLLSYGGLFGGVSVLGLVLNGLLSLAFLSFTQATLTLPGIAGLILTLAVAVDANVLIYERTREEARAGRSPMAAADAGYSRALITIIDANLTTLVAALIMLALGSGPVRGFAWTLSIGVFTSVFSAVMVSQLLLGLWFRWSRPKKLPIL